MMTTLTKVGTVVALVVGCIVLKMSVEDKEYKNIMWMRKFGNH